MQHQITDMSVHTGLKISQKLCLAKYDLNSRWKFTLQITDMANSHRIKITDFSCNYYKLPEFSNKPNTARMTDYILL